MNSQVERTLELDPASMPDFIQDALHKRSLMDAYLARPPYQRNDYIGWITCARLKPTG